MMKTVRLRIEKATMNIAIMIAKILEQEQGLLLSSFKNNMMGMMKQTYLTQFLQMAR